MPRLTMAMMILAGVAILVGFGFAGAWLRGVIYAGLVFETARVWWRARVSDGPVSEAADNIAAMAATLALFLAASAPWEIFEDWIAALHQ